MQVEYGGNVRVVILKVGCQSVVHTPYIPYGSGPGELPLGWFPNSMSTQYAQYAVCSIQYVTYESVSMM